MASRRLAYWASGQGRLSNVPILAGVNLAEPPSSASIWVPYRAFTSSLDHHSINLHAASLSSAEESMMVAVRVELADRSMWPSSCTVPGMGTMSQRPLISGAAATSWLYML